MPRRRLVTEEMKQKIRELRADGIPPVLIAQRFGLAQSTVYHIK